MSSYFNFFSSAAAESLFHLAEAVAQEVFHQVDSHSPPTWSP